MIKARGVGVFHEVPNIQVELANVSTLRGDYETASLHLERALDLAERYPWGAAKASVANAAGFLARRTGRLDDAIAYHTNAMSIYYEGELPLGITYSVSSLGFAEELAGELEIAESHHMEGLKLIHGFENAPAIQRDLAAAFAIEGLAAVAAARGNGTRAATLLGAAHRLRSDHGVPLPSGEDLDVARARDVAIETAGRADYDAAFASGYDMPPQDLDVYVVDQA